MKRKNIIPILIFVLLALVFAVSPLFAANENNDGDTTADNTDTATDSDATPGKSGGLIALTFDDGPGNCTGELLDALKKRDIKVTFFIVGSRVEEYSDIIKREYKEGHELACHTWSHTNLVTLDAAGIQSEITQTKTAINAAIGADIGKMLLRPPGGNYNDTVKSSVGTPIILWSVDPKDWKYRDAETVRSNILASAEDGSIILLHDLYPTSVEGAIAAIDELQAEGYTFVTVSELFRRKGLTLTDGEVYMNAPNDGVDLGPLPEKKEQKTATDNEQTNKNDADKASFPWGLLIFCIIVLLVNAAGLLRLFWGCTPKWREKNNEKNDPDRDFGNRRNIDNHVSDQRIRNGLDDYDDRK